MSDHDDLVKRLADEGERLSGRSIDRGCVDSGIASILADEASATIEALQAENARLTARVAELEGRFFDGGRSLPFARDDLGRMVREAWVRWALTQPNPKPSWLVPYHELNEADKEADRQIGEAIARWTLVGDASNASAMTLTEAVAHWRQSAHDRRTERDTAQARLAKAVEALKVFTGHYKPWMDEYPDHVTSHSFPAHTLGDIRQARATLAELEEGHGPA